MTWRAILAVAALLLSPGAMAQSKYPHPAVTLVTHSSPGGGSDVFLRELIKHLGPAMGVSFTVENVRGGSGAKAVAQVAQSPPNGTILYATTPTYIQTTLLSKPAVGYSGLDPLVILFLDPEVIYTRADAPWKTLAEAVDYAKTNPGKAKWGAANPASLERIALERLSRLAGVKVPVVSHEGGADLMINVLNGTLDIGVGEIQEMQAQLGARKILLLATLSDKRLATFPDLPTAREQGFDLAVRKFRGLAGPKGIPDDIAKAWETALKQVIDSPAYKAGYTKDSLIPVAMGREEARRFTSEVAEEIAASFKELGIVK
jgi:putative tricarboxylic transport membrane protein